MSDIVFNESNILLNVEAITSEEVLTIMGKKLHHLGLVKESFVNAVISREKSFPTGLPTSSIAVAIPHTDPHHVKQKTICFAALKDQVDFGVMGETDVNTPVKLVFMLAMTEAESQLSLLKHLIDLFQEEDTLMMLVNETTETKIYDIISSKLNLSDKGGE
ncbi:PTS sugar transporter subunit IIA [Halalkalibacterium halodurans]|uniref:PTS system, galactitol-specific enzyme II, A component n=2 Tax=Halalkalibacterium halodurans TaxID=86665 RepID=Q7AK15_HALH5|nr:PTS sugar transporter subunit IIA [Halalkalibacterium halodurans]MED4081291.1 PTS sugar transporter subunit IIA [Halalkalibacterium halodurans]MED4084006.1 PTS sugar transporter subunit IIA [Halalkalibacterium halodurans]MED4105989.1 PTS sugar transporter subunit IIA [Halalkalibacterium halodurans]MED4107337.1 PTS sugar transporter subunit IIA [Halalkalibacterium halodurans]MED4148830.1 PTS sugar transporter subunit IIA [Halalkalibacterium halodurans]